MILFDEESHAYSDGSGAEFPSVTTVLQAEGFIETRYFPEGAAERGQIVHAVTAALELGQEPGFCPGPLKGYVEAYLAWKAESGFHADLVEHRFISKRWGFAGTADRVGSLDERPALVDLKTGRPHRWHGLQLGGYELGLESPTPLLRFGLYLAEDGRYSMVRYQDRTDRDVFLAALTCYRWKAGAK